MAKYCYFCKLKYVLMKKILLFLLFLLVIAVVLPSCERRCICTYLDSGAEQLMGNAYTKKDCRAYEDDLNDLGMNVQCDFK